MPLWKRWKRTSFLDSLWYQGTLTWHLRAHGQMRIHEFIRGLTDSGSIEPIVINGHRRLGKSFLPLLHGIEACLRAPGLRVLYGAPTYPQVQGIILPLFDLIMETCPDDLRPKRSGYQWHWRNPRWTEPGESILHIVGVDWKRGDRLRGAYADRIYLDEVGQMTELRYLVEEVLLPQTIARPGAQVVLITTPPRTMDHDWVTYFMPRAIEAGRYICIRGSENPDFSEEDRERMRKALGGEETIAWRREIECELVADPSDLITPEWRDDLIVVFSGEADTGGYKVIEHPKYFFPYVCMDTGYDPDHTAILLGYPDWLNQVLVIEDEVFRPRMTTLDIQKAVRSKEAALWGKRPAHPVRRIADMDPRGLADLSRQYKLNFLPVEKHDAYASIARLRARLQTRQVFVHRRCVNLINQLRHGIWNKKRTDFERTDTMGHWDAGKALCYLNRQVNFNDNPIPDEAVDIDNRFRLTRRTSRIEGTLMKALGRR